MSNKIIYTIITKQKNTPLCSYSKYSGNFKIISSALLSELINYKQFIGVYKGYTFYYLYEDNIKILAVIDSMSIKKAFSYLYDIKFEFTSLYPKNIIESAQEHTMKSFCKNIELLISNYENNKNKLNHKVNSLNVDKIPKERIQKFIEDFDEIKGSISSKSTKFNDNRNFQLSVYI